MGCVVQARRVCVTPMYELFMSSTSGIVFKPSAGAITDHSQPAKDIEAYFKYQLYMEEPATESRYSYTEWDQ